MDRLLYWLALGLVNSLQALPLRWVALLGRAGGTLAYWIDARHRRVAIENLTRCFGDQKSRREIRALARENFRRLGENYGCGIKTAGMTWPELEPHLAFGGLEKLHPIQEPERRPPTRRDRNEMDRAGSETGAPFVVEERERSERRSAEVSSPVLTLPRSDAPTSRVVAIGHFRNFDLHA